MTRYWYVLKQRLNLFGTRVASENDGVLSFEWVLLLTMLTIGIVSGVTAARDAIIDELGDVAEAAQGFDQSYSLAAVVVRDPDTNVIIFTAAASSFTEGPEDAVVIDCGRTSLGSPDQGGQNDGSDGG
jgi:hypothetical protein